MAQLDIARGYENGQILLEADLDAIQSAITTFFNVTGLNDDNFRDNSITASSKLIDSSIVTDKIDDEAVTTAKIADDDVTTAKINDGAITTAKILASNVTTAKIADLAVTSDKFADGAITVAKISALGQQLSDEVSGAAVSAAASEADVTNASVAITTTGRPVFIYLQRGPTSITSDSGDLIAADGTDSTVQEGVLFKLYRGATAITGFIFSFEVAYTGAFDGDFPAWQIWYIDAPAAGTYTYKLTAQGLGTNVDWGSGNYKLMAYELL